MSQNTVSTPPRRHATPRSIADAHPLAPEGRSLHELERELERVRHENEELGVPEPQLPRKKKRNNDGTIDEEEEEDPAEVLPEWMAFGVRRIFGSKFTSSPRACSRSATGLTVACTSSSIC